LFFENTLCPDHTAAAPTSFSAAQQITIKTSLAFGHGVRVCPPLTEALFVFTVGTMISAFSDGGARHPTFQKEDHIFFINKGPAACQPPF